MANTNKRIPKKVYCKKARFQSNGVNKETLQELIQASIKALPKAKKRREVIGGTEDYYRLINNFSVVDGAFCGVMVAYESGTNALTLSEEEDAETYTIEQLAPPAQDGKRREFLDGLLFFAIRSNHVAVIQSQSLRSAEFEQHLLWLIKQASKVNQGVLFSLDDSISKRVVEKIKQQHVKTIQIGGPLVVAKDAGGHVLDYEQRSSKKQSFTIGGFGPDLLNALGRRLPKSLKFKDALDENIKLSLQIQYIRSVSDKGQQLLDTLAIALRNHDGSDTKLILNDGSEVTGEHLKLTANLKLTTINGVVLPDSAFVELVNWLNGLIKSGDVTP